MARKSIVKIKHKQKRRPIGLLLIIVILIAANAFWVVKVVKLENRLEFQDSPLAYIDSVMRSLGSKLDKIEEKVLRYEQTTTANEKNIRALNEQAGRNGEIYMKNFKSIDETLQNYRQAIEVEENNIKNLNEQIGKNHEIYMKNFRLIEEAVKGQ